MAITYIVILILYDKSIIGKICLMNCTNKCVYCQTSNLTGIKALMGETKLPQLPFSNYVNLKKNVKSIFR